MIFFTRCLGVFVLLWIVFYIGVSALWTGDHVVSASILYGGFLSIVFTLIYGWIDEVWIQHRKS